MDNTEIKSIKDDLELLKKAVAEIKLSLDPDMLLDEDDTKSLQIYNMEKTDNTLVHHEKVKNDLS